MISSKYSIEYNGLYYIPLNRKQLLDFVMGLAPINRFDELQSTYFKQKEIIYNSLNNDQKFEIISLYRNFFYKRIKPYKIPVMLKNFNFNNIPYPLYKDFENFQDHQIIDEFVSLQAHRTTKLETSEDLFNFDGELEFPIDYSSQINALLILENFNDHRQELQSFKTKLNAIQIVILFKQKGESSFIVSLILKNEKS